ncbi:MAG: hypothetical protein COX70_06535 [Flavobacteriales bacterium CG_4_10_14_0_2_um_filter_32_8]|nr:MAG: hypothetical protein COX70_06535 [Flavobacteriales bacterium CG_4_10_14_0_2_um_filter_32_8]PJB14442.1 MAG: hypothetical protein CO118_08580 [Flavobacteriales bacterium CG_4_9_14_3_um_filter_32_8]
MKKLILSVSLFGLFLLFGNTVSAQATIAVVQKIDAATNSAITSIKENKSLKDAEKEKFVLRIETFASAAKKNEDARAIEVFEAEYNRIAENYKRTTGNELPELIANK